MHPKTTLSAWQNPTVIAVTMTFTSNGYKQVSVIRSVIQGVIRITEWREFETVLEMIAEEATNKHRSDRLFSLKDYILAESDSWTITKQGDVYSLTVDGYQLTITTKKIRGHSNEYDLILTVRLPDASKGKEIMDKFREATSRMENAHTSGVEFENKLYVRGRDEDDFVFTKGSLERLGDRMTRLPGDMWKRREPPVYVVAPLEGETLVIYGDRSVTRDLGISVPWSRSMVLHPEEAVFASVGPFSMAVKIDDHRAPRHVRRDHVAVFEDSRLPISPPAESETEEYEGGGDFEPDRFPGWEPDEW